MTFYHTNRKQKSYITSGHCMENCTGSHLENEVTATSSKSTPFKPIRRSLRQLMVRNENDYIEHVKSCSGVENKTFSANLTTSKSTNVIPATSSHNRTRLTLTNSSHCTENYAGSHLENEVTATYKTTPSKPTGRSLRQFRRSFRQLMLGNDNDYISSEENTDEELWFSQLAMV